MSFDITKVPMVRVTWLDARDMETGWLPIKDIINAPLAVCQEVGWMVVNTSEKIIVMRSWCTDKDDNHGGGSIAIPKGWVTKIEYLYVGYSESN
tara:strand:+ start:34 stop:315 length:282 start_codon:yes stop_codon:yes gene_type:complete